ncbi:MAG: hypothetical protein IKO93_12480 [Lentisphaeria bacterium]|nr:hypothetical protein [Lentisphaeria bacterium]
MSAKLNTVFTALFCLAAAAAAPLLKAGDEIKFDAEKRIYTIGGKQLKCEDNANLTILSNGKKIASTYQFIATPYKYWQTSVKKKDGEYDGKQMEVREIKIDGDQVTYNGLISWNKPDEKPLSGAWKVTVKPVGDGKIAVYCTYDVPQGQKRRDCGIFMNVPGIKEMNCGKLGTWVPFPKPEKNLSNWKPASYQLIGKNAGDSFKIEAPIMTTQGSSLRFNFLLKAKEKASFVLDFGKSAEPEASK